MRALREDQRRVVAAFQERAANAEEKARMLAQEAHLARTALNAILRAHIDAPEGVRVKYDPETGTIQLLEEAE